MKGSGSDFPKRLRLLARTEFKRLSDSKTLVVGQSFLVVWRENNLSHPRLGITASRKSGNSVTRNRIKRQIREYFRLNRHILPAVDLNIIVKKYAASVPVAFLVSELTTAFERIGSEIC